MVSSHLPRIIELVKYPNPGQVKTRLAFALGDEGAAALQRRMALFVFEAISRAAALAGASVEICYDGADEAAFRRMFGDQATFALQAKGDLGSRIHCAFLRAFENGAGRAVLTGSDCPCVTAAVLCESLDALDTHDAVIGPADDGGYYLIGLAKPAPCLFEDMPWSTDAVFEKTVSRLRDAGMSYRVLEKGWDVDRPEDVCRFEEAEQKYR